MLKDGDKLVVQNLRKRLQNILTQLGTGRQRLCVQLQVVCGHICYGEQHNTFQEVEHGSRQAVGLNTFPLLPDEEVFVGLHALIEVNAVIEFDSGVIFL